MRVRELATAVCLAASMPVLAAVTVTNSDPNKFTDVEDKNSSPDQVMGELKAHLEKLGERYLAAETNVNVEVFDVDRAGRPRMGRNDIRIMTGRSDFPCIDLASGAEGQTQKREKVCDLDYLRSLPPPYNAGESLVFEKRMLDEWFKKRFKDAGLLKK
jgi:hypothetical protein